MRTWQRCVLPELLDDMVPGDPRAQRSRRDLQRVHVAMGTIGILRNAVLRLPGSSPPRRILELGAGDGTLTLRLARKMATRWKDVELTLLDRHDLIDSATRAGFQALGWRVSVLETDVVEWARQPHSHSYDLSMTSLFLHHFEQGDLMQILSAVATRSNVFIACEPGRDAWGWLGSHLVGLIGGNAITRSDAVTSVAAGFTGREISAAWPQPHDRWVIKERRVFPFTHYFAACARDMQSHVSHS